MATEKTVQDAYLRGQQLMRERAAKEIESAAGRASCKCAKEELIRLARKIIDAAVVPLGPEAEKL